MNTPLLDYAPPDPAIRRRVALLWTLLRIFLGTVAFVLCAISGLFIPPMWEGVSGRDFRPAATNSALLLLLLATVLRVFLRWRLLDFLAIVVVIQALTLMAINHFTGFSWSEIFHWFNLSWLGMLSVFTALPWMLGVALGTGILWLRRARPNG